MPRGTRGLKALIESTPASHTTGRTRAAKFAASNMSRHFLCFDSSISRAQRVAFYMAANAALPERTYAANVTEPRLIADPLHPAFGQFGLFATARIPSQTVLMCYGGFVQAHGVFPCSQAYTMGYGGVNDDLEIDSEFVGNLARFANDPRGCPGTPGANLVAQSKHNRLGEAFTAIITKRMIMPGEELLLSYGSRHRLSGHHWVTRDGRRLSRPRIMPPMSGAARTVDDRLAEAGVNLVWQCASCGTWTERLDAVLIVAVCGSCGCPRAARAPVAALPKGTVRAAEKRPRTRSTEKGLEDVGRHVHVPPPNVPLDAELTVNHEVIAAQLQCHLPAVAGASPPASLSSPWPMDFPLVTWQVWDPEVPHTLVQRYAVFHQQKGIHICDQGEIGADDASNADAGRVTSVVAANKYERGDEVAVLGGLLVHEGDPRIDSAPLKVFIVDACMAACAGEGEEEVREIFLIAGDNVVPRLVLLVANELICAKRSKDPSIANVVPHLRRDPLGFLFVALIATRPLGHDDEVVVLAKNG
jgi:hypothetical protein